MEMALMQARGHTHILTWPLDLREYVSLDFSFRAQYLYYISAVSHGRAALSIFLRFPTCSEVRIFMDAFP